MINTAPPTFRGRNAFSLIEVTIAIGLMSFCFVALIGLLPVGLRQERLSTEKIEALEMLAAVAADIQLDTNPADPTNPGQTPQFGIALPAVGGDTASASFLLDESGGLVTDSGKAAFKVWHEITPPASRYAPYLIHIYVASAPSSLQVTTVSGLKSHDFVESVVSKNIY